MQNKKLARAAGALMIITILSKAVGFLRETLIAGAFGASYVTDAYNIAIVVPSVIYGLFGGAITTIFIPLFSESYAKKGKEDAFEYANTILNIMFLISLLLFVVSVIFTPQIVKIVAPKFRGDTYKLAVILTKISVINIVLITMNNCYTALLQSLDEFVVPAMLGFITSIPIIGYVILGAGGGIQGLIIVVVAGTALQVIFQIPWLLKKGFRFSLKVNLKDPRLKRMLYLMLPVLVGSGVSQINTLVDKSMASGLPGGSIASLNFANEINSIITSIFITAVVTVIYPTLARIGTDENRDNYKSLVSKSVNTISLIVLPCTVAMIILRIPVIDLLFKHGKFDERAVGMTAGALLFYSLGLVFIGIRDVFGKAFYAIQDTKTPMMNAIIGIFFNIVLNLTLVKFMGIRGLALATSTSAAICAILLGINLKKKVDGVNFKMLFSTGMKIIISSAVMGIVIFAVKVFLGGHLTGKMGDLILILISAVVGIGVYAAMAAFLKIEEFYVFIDMLKAKIKK